MSKIIMFHGASCPHCHHMMPIVDKITEEKLENLKIEKLEVWENPENAKKMKGFKDIILSACKDGLGVPAFVDPEKGRAICGEFTYKELKEWMQK